MRICAKFQLPSLSRGGLKVPGGGMGCGGVVVEAHFTVQLKGRVQKKKKISGKFH